jgi:hypothetical protein
MLRVAFNFDWAIIGLALWMTILALIGYAAIAAQWPRHRPRR